MLRRHFLATLAAASAPLSLRAQTTGAPLPGANLEEKFRILKELGCDVELQRC